MPVQPVVVQLQCPNPECGRVVKVKRPSKPGKYSLPCPSCGAKIPMIVPAPQTPQFQQQFDQQQYQPFQQQQQQQQLQLQQQQQKAPAPNNMFADPKWDKTTYLKDEPASVSCAFGCGYVHQTVPEKVGENIFMCPTCKGKTRYNVRDKTVMVQNDIIGDRKPFRGKLLLLRTGWYNKEFKLRTGSNIIGRYDSSSAGAIADIAIKDDPSMSRRSVDINVSYDDMGGFRFDLTVLKATNPVLINHLPVGMGESVSLNYGDSIIMGKTQFRFDKDVNC